MSGSLAIIVPYYCGKVHLEPLIERLHKSLDGYISDWTVCFVDDRSPDNGWVELKALADSDPNVVSIRLSRNFGQHAAITAGLHEMDADWYVVMDCDLQDRPEDIPAMMDMARADDKDVVIARRPSSGLGKRRSYGSALFNGFLSWLTGFEVSSETGNFRVFKKKVVEAYRGYDEQLRFFPAIMSQLGFDAAYITVTRDERVGDNSSYTYKKLLSLAFDAFIAYSDRPLRSMALFGLGITLLMSAISITYFVRALLVGFEVAGFATLIISVFFIGGIQIFLISFVGLYVGQALKEAKRRPHYIIDDIHGL